MTAEALTTEQLRERGAEIIYDVLPFHGLYPSGKRPAWVNCDNAILQNNCRRTFDTILSLIERAQGTGGGDAVKPKRMFPILRGTPIPWDAIAPFDYQARENHGGQNLEQLARRGGLSANEAVCVIECRRWTKMEERAAILRLIELTTPKVEAKAPEVTPASWPVLADEGSGP